MAETGPGITREQTFSAPREVGCGHRSIATPPARFIPSNLVPLSAPSAPT